MSIRTQILLLAFIVAIPAAGIIVYSGIHTREEAIHDARLETQQLAGNIAAEQQNLIVSAQQLIIALAQLPEVKKQDGDRIEPILRDILKLNAQYANIIIADRKGLVWATAVPTKPPYIVSDRNYFKNALASGQLSSGEYVIGRATARPVFNIAYPLRNDRGKIVGIIDVAFRLDAYKQVLERAKLSADASFVLLDHNGIVLYRPAGSEEYLGNPYNPSLFKQMQEGPDGDTLIGKTGFTDNQRILTYRKLWLPGEREPYMYIRAGVPVSTVLADANKVLIRNVTLFTSSLCLAILFAWLIGRRSIADRITLLEKASRNLAGGNLDIRVSDLVTGGELGSLGQTFDAMAHQLSLRQQALAESERNYRDIFNTTKDAVFVHDAKSGIIVEINKTVEDMYGYTREELLNQQVLDFNIGESPYSLRDALEWIHKAYEEGPQQFVWLSKKKNGEQFWTEVVLSRTQIGGVGRVLAVVRNITERKRIEEALRDAALIARQNPYPVLRVGRDGKLLFSNPCPASKTLLTEWQAEIGKIVPDFVRHIVMQSLTDGVNKELEITSSGHELTFMVIPIPDLDYANLYGHDITDRKKAEADVLKLNKDMAARNVELESVNKELEFFIYSVSHDLRSPIRTMAGFAAIMIEDYANKLDDNGKDYLSRIQAGSEKMARLIEDLLKLSQITRQDMVRVETDLSDKASAVMLELRAGGSGRNVEVTIQPGLKAFADPRLIEVALSNILGNALKFTSKTKEARIEFGAIQKDGTNVYFSKDNGAGFDPAYTGKLFLPFHRLHTDKEFEGTGIGLAIVERIIRRHAGKVWAEGKVGEGATVYFTLG